MNRCLFASAWLTVLSALTPAYSAECVCATVPLYPVPGGYLHYGIVVDRANCSQLYATSAIRSTSVIESCTPLNCGTCSALPVSGPSPDNYYYSTRPMDVAGLSSIEQFRQHVFTPPSGSGRLPEYNNWSFEEPEVIALVRRKNGMQETFYATIAKFTRPTGSTLSNPRYSVFAGYEVEGATGTMQPLNPQRAMITTIRSDQLHETEAVGMVMVDLPNGKGTAFIRLASDTNADTEFERGSLARVRFTEQRSGMESLVSNPSSSSLNSTSMQVSSPAVTLSSFPPPTPLWSNDVASHGVNDQSLQFAVGNAPSSDWNGGAVPIPVNICYSAQPCGNDYVCRCACRCRPVRGGCRRR